MKLDLKEWIAKITGQAEFKTLLWTNTTNPFNAQTVSLDLSKYDAVEVWFSNSSNVDVMLPNPVRVKIGHLGWIVYFHNLFGDGVNENTGARPITPSSSGVYFGNYRYKNRRSGGTQTTANQFCVPWRIYGIKYVGE